MCLKTPKVKTQAVEVAAADLVPKVDAPAPEAPEMGGTSDSFNHKKGRKQLTIERSASFNPVNF